MAEKFYTPGWIISALFTLCLLFGGAAWAYQSNAITAVESKVEKEREKNSQQDQHLTKIDAVLEGQKQFQEEFKEMHQELHEVIGDRRRVR